MNSQEVFDKVVTHLRSQNVQAMSHAFGGCHYRTENNLKCAVGCLIPDGEYRDWFEGYSVIDLLNKITGKILDKAVDKEDFPILLSLKKHQSLLASLQTVHDSSATENWENGFQEVALGHKLQYRKPA